MEQFDPIDIEFIINNDEVKASANKVKDDLKSVGQTAEEAATKVNSQLKGAFAREDNAGAVAAMNKKLKEQAAIIQRSRPQYNGLGNSINQISREMSAFTVSAQTGFLAISNNIPILADEIQRLKDRNAELTASGEKAVPVWKQVVKGIFSWQTALSIGITLLTVYGKEVATWIGTLFKGKGAIDELKASQEALNKAYDSSNFRGVIKSMLELRSYIDLAKKGVIDKKFAVDEYNKTLGEVAGKVDTLAEAEQGVIDKAPAYVKAMLYKAAADAASAEAAEKLAENKKKQNEINNRLSDLKQNAPTTIDLGSLGTGQNTAQLNQLQAINGAEVERNKLIEDRNSLEKSSTKIITDLLNQAQEIADKAGLNIFKSKNDKSDKAKIESEYQNLIDKLSEIDKEYSRKSFTKDQEELQALRDKFDKIRQLVERFNADPKNKAQIIDLSNLDKLQAKAEASLTYRQTTENLKDELDKQQKLFEAFETYKAQFGIEAAKKEFEGRIGEASSYYEFIKKQQKANEEAYKAVDNGTATGAQIERVKLLNQALATESAKQKKLFDEQLANLKSYEEERKLIIEKYQALISQALSNGDKDAVEKFKQEQDRQLEALDDAQVKKLKSYTALFEGIKNLSKEAAKKVISDAKKLLEIQGISAELKAKILKQIAEAEKLLNSTNLDDIYKIAGAIGSLGQSLANLGDSLGNSALSDAGNLLSGLASGVDGLLTVFDKDSSTADKVTAGIQGVINLVGMFASAAAKRKAAEEAYYLSVIGFQNEYNLALNEQIRLQSILDENVFIKDYEGRVKDALESIKAANEEYQKSIDKLIDVGKVKIGQRNAVDFGNVGSGAANGALVGAAVGSVVPVIGTVVGAIGGAILGAIGGIFGGKKKKDRYADILKEYPELIQKSKNGVRKLNVELAQSLIDHELINKETKLVLENILDWQKQLEEARKQIKEVISELTGSLSNDLRDNLVEAFTAGENAAIKMGDTVDKVLENILSNLVFNNVFGGVFDDLQAQMAASFDIGGDGSWVDDFSRFFAQANALTGDFNDALAAAQQEAANFGFDIFKKDNPANANQGLTGAIRRDITEATAGELAGLFRGQYDVTKRLFEATEIYFEKEIEHRAHLVDLISINTKIESNTASTVLELQRAVVELQNISENTKQIYLLDLG